MKKRKPKRPYFAKARMLKDGSVELIDDEGDIYHVQMHRRARWPILSRQARRFEMWFPEDDEKKSEPKPEGPPNLKVV